MFIKRLECFHCGKRFKRGMLLYRCGKCNGSLEIVYDYTRLKELNWRRLRKRAFNHWRYKEFYPHCQNIITLDEGGTQLVKSKFDQTIFYKLELQNPTGSFKDRGSTIEVSHARDLKARGVICASTGNMGTSIAAYSARAGLPCEIVLPTVTTKEKVRQIRIFGAKITRVKGDYALAAKTAYKKFQYHQGFLVGDYSFRGEGEKSVGFEIIDQLIERKLASHQLYIVCPVGNGTLISAIWKGFKEFKKIGLVQAPLILIGVQAIGCNPISRSFKTNTPIKKLIPKTIAGAIACGDPLDGEKAVRAIKESNGRVIEVSDKEMLTARKAMATSEGIDSEPSGAAAYAAIKKLNLPKNAIKVLVITGHGLKDLKHVK